MMTCLEDNYVIPKYQIVNLRWAIQMIIKDTGIKPTGHIKEVLKLFEVV